MTSWLWPIQTGRTVFDGATVVHAAFWLVVSAHVRLFGVGLWPALIAALLLALAWEVFERTAERKWPSLWRHPETWPNAILGDVVFATTFGVVAGYRLLGP